MQDLPSISRLTDAVCEFLETRVAPQLHGHDAFHLRIALNLLRMGQRAALCAATHEAATRARLQALLTSDEDDLLVLNHMLCHALRNGALTLDMPALRAHLVTTTMDKLAIDQPNYAGLHRAQNRGWPDKA